MNDIDTNEPAPAQFTTLQSDESLGPELNLDVILDVPVTLSLEVLFVTVDPERDTKELLAQYVPTFDPRFLGLYGTAEQTATVAKEFKIFYAKVPGSDAANYSVDHTAASRVKG